MTDQRFNELLAGPLAHPFPMFTITRLTLALRAVVEATGGAGERALEEHCAVRQQQDERVDEGVDDIDIDASDFTDDPGMGDGGFDPSNGLRDGEPGGRS